MVLCARQMQAYTATCLDVLGALLESSLQRNFDTARALKLAHLRLCRRHHHPLATDDVHVQDRLTMIHSVLVSCLVILGLGVNGAVAQTGRGQVTGTAQPGTMLDTYTIPYSQHDQSQPSGCSEQYAGCTGELVTLQHEVAGSVTVLDDCTFRISGWQFDGEGPAVEWWGAKQSGDPKMFPYPGTARKIGELGVRGSYQKGVTACTLPAA
jgi:hypothetical protein